MAPSGPEKLWDYARLARTWSWALIVVGLLLLGVSPALQATSPTGVSPRYLGILVAVTGATGLVFFPFLRVWLRRGAMPSARLPQAAKLAGPRRLEASPSDWRRFRLTMGGVLLVGSAAMLVFLVGVLGRGGTAEGVVIGVLLAWGLATLEDARRITRAEAEEGRRYFAACQRPTGVGRKLVWVKDRSAAPLSAG